MANKNLESAPASRMARRLGAARAWVVALPAPAALALVATAAAEPPVAMSALGGVPVGVPALRAECREAAASGRPAIVDVSLATSALCSPCALGADACVESLGRAMGERGVALSVVAASRESARLLPGLPATLESAGVVVSDPSLFDEVSRALDASDAPARAASDAAQVVACFLRCHPLVSAVRYPGLAGDPSQEAAAATLHGGFGPRVDLSLVPGVDPSAVCDAFASGLAPSRLGEPSLVEIPGTAWLRLDVGFASCDFAAAATVPDGVGLSMRLEGALSVADL